MGLLSQLKSLFASRPAADDHPPTITVYDKFGRQFEIARDAWRTQMLPDQLAEANDDADALYTIIVGAIDDGFERDVLPASARLLEMDKNRERAHAVRAIVLMKTGDLDGAEAVLNDYIERFGPTGVILTNLAKVQSARGHDAEAEATLWLALTHDPNQDNGLAWFCSLEHEKGGDDAMWQAIRRAAEIKGSWRPQLWLARRALEQRNLAEARQYYSDVLRQVVDEPDVLTMISGDLGNHGYINEILEIVRPVYDPHRHDPRAGMNLLQAFLQTGRAAEGEELLHELFALNRPDLRDHLFHYSNEFAKLNESAETRATAPGEALDCELVRVEHPMWSQGLNNPAWLFSPAARTGEEVVFFPLANVTPTDRTEAVVQREDEAGRLTRSLALYLAEAAYFWTACRAKAVIPVVRGGGAIVSGSRWPEEYVFDFADGARFALSGALEQSGQRLRIELTLWDCSEREAIRQFECATSWDELGSGLLQLEQEVLSALGGPRSSPSDDFYARPSAESLSQYLLCLGQSTTLSMVQSGIIRRDALWGERHIFQSCLALVLAMPDAQVPRILFLGALVKGHDYGSVVYSEFKEQALELIDKEQDRASPVYRLSPLFLKAFDMRRFETRRAELLQNAKGPYRAWLESLVEA